MVPDDGAPVAFSLPAEYRERVPPKHALSAKQVGFITRDITNAFRLGEEKASKHHNDKVADPEASIDGQCTSSFVTHAAQPVYRLTTTPSAAAELQASTPVQRATTARAVVHELCSRDDELCTMHPHIKKSGTSSDDGWGAPPPATDDWQTPQPPIGDESDISDAHIDDKSDLPAIPRYEVVPPLQVVLAPSVKLLTSSLPSTEANHEDQAPESMAHVEGLVSVPVIDGHEEATASFTEYEEPEFGKYKQAEVFMSAKDIDGGSFDQSSSKPRVAWTAAQNKVVNVPPLDIVVGTPVALVDLGQHTDFALQLIVVDEATRPIEVLSLAF
ncbi:hypothetical protein FNAPI_4514 [Fusarium napiforme]|uniref:Uncharacterized protein n=1 Tax=Fusarium napiforme TaxID=42672 RepID=A0A8H5JQR7_9HYPO|nr:hypothetical protein FNAPI_4514 [Fusarium napiforme]